MMLLLSCRYCKLTYEDVQYPVDPSCPKCKQPYLELVARYPVYEENEEAKKTSTPGR